MKNGKSCQLPEFFTLYLDLVSNIRSKSSDFEQKKRPLLVEDVFFELVNWKLTVDSRSSLATS
jgi:hypothetical protein